MFEMFLKKNTLSSKNNAFFLQKKSPVFLLSFIIANGHLKIQMLQFNINIINTVNKKKQYQHSGVISLDTESLCPIYELDCQFSHSS